MKSPIFCNLTVNPVTLPIIRQMAEYTESIFFIFTADEKMELICGNSALLSTLGRINGGVSEGCPLQGVLKPDVLPDPSETEPQSVRFSFKHGDGTRGEFVALCVYGEDEAGGHYTALADGETGHPADEEIHRRDTEIIGILASEYTSVYYIDLTTDALTPYTMNEETETTFGSVFRSGITYSEAYSLYVDRLIYPEDRAMMLQAGSADNIIRQLANQKTFLTRYRSADNKYSEMKFVKVGDEFDEPVAVALGFAEKDDEIRAEQEREIERQRYTAVVKALSSEYSSIYYVDFEENVVLPYSSSERINDRFGRNPFNGMSYSEAVQAYIRVACSPEDRVTLSRALSVDGIRQQLDGRMYFTYIYRNDQDQYCEMKCVRVDETPDIRHVVLGFAVKDGEIRSRRQAEQIRQRNFDIIEILASEYSSVYYIDLTTDELDPYTMNADTESAFGKIFRSGIRYSEAYRMYVDQLILSEDKPMMLLAGSLGNIMKELRTKKTFLTTYRSSDGHYCEMKFVKVGNEEGVPTAVALGFADKDDELRAREEEQRQRQRNIDIIEILASEYTSVYYIDLMTDDLEPYTMNEETETEFGSIFRSGIKYSDAFQLYVDTLVYPDDKARMLRAGSRYNILKELGSKKTFLTTYRNSEGRYSEMKFVKVGDSENPQAVALGFADKDDEIRAEMERKAATDRDMAVISGLSDDFGCVVYVDYNDASEIHYRFDPVFEKYIPGWSSITNFAERLRRLNETLVHPDDRQAFSASTRGNVVRAAIDADGVYFVNFRVVIDGHITYYQAKFVRDDSHAETHFIAGFHNVDAETRREMDALERAETASRAKTDFLFNMSHDIRTPMNAIIGFTKMAMKDAGDNEKVQESLKKVRMSSDMLLSIINDILDMSRIESGKVTLQELPADIGAPFEQLEPVMNQLARSKNIELTFSMRGIRDRRVYLDMPRVERILTNIISNGIKYTREGGFVRVNAVQLTGRKPGYGLYRFTVQDNGIGMSEEFQKHMFEEFAREESSTISGIQGTGLGLSLAQKLTAVMGGTLTCVSRQGVGSTFTVTLPFRLLEIEAQSTADTEEETGEMDLSGRRVLLVDDNELNREIAADILEDHGLIVEMTVNGREAVETLVERGSDYYDFILMDIQMPVLNGYEATEEIRRRMPDLRAPIIALSANAFEEDKMKSAAAGMDAHIAKPISMTELFGTLRKFL